MVRSPGGSSGLKKGAWSAEEDKILREYIEKHGAGNWVSVPTKSRLNRCAKSCRLRWINYLRPGIKRGNFTSEEEETIIYQHSLHGNKWSTIASHLPGRIDNDIKNFWNTRIRKKLLRSGIDPQTYQPLPYMINQLSTCGLTDLIMNDPWRYQLLSLVDQLAFFTFLLPESHNSYTVSSTKEFDIGFMNSLENIPETLIYDQPNNNGIITSEYPPSASGLATSETFIEDRIDSVLIPGQSIVSNSFETHGSLVDDDVDSYFWGI